MSSSGAGLCSGGGFGGSSAVGSGEGVGKEDTRVSESPPSIRAQSRSEHVGLWPQSADGDETRFISKICVQSVS